MPPLQQHTYHRARLTGKTRLRRQWLTGCLVQQVQEVHEERIGHTTPAPPPQRGDTWAHRLWRLASHQAQEAGSWTAKRYTWRDATESDMAAMQELPAQSNIPNPWRRPFLMTFKDKVYAGSWAVPKRLNLKTCTVERLAELLQGLPHEVTLRLVRETGEIGVFEPDYSVFDGGGEVSTAQPGGAAPIGQLHTEGGQPLGDQEPQRRSAGVVLLEIRGLRHDERPLKEG